MNTATASTINYDHLASRSVVLCFDGCSMAWQSDSKQASTGFDIDLRMQGKKGRGVIQIVSSSHPHPKSSYSSS